MKIKGFFRSKKSYDAKKYSDKPIRKAIFITGIVIVIAALFLIGYSIYDMIDSEELVESSLNEAKQFTAASLAPSPPVPLHSPQESDNVMINSSLSPSPSPPPSPSPTPAISAEKARKGHVIGYITFNTILYNDKPREVPIIEGTANAQLKKGAGHYEGFPYPGEGGNCPIFGHRTTVFKDFDKLEIGDSIEIKTSYGDFTYSIIDMQIAEPMAPLMFKVYDDPVLTLITCYPFIYAGHAPKRYIVICSLEGSIVEWQPSEN